MEVASGDLIHAAFKDKRLAGGSSNKMEPLAFFEGRQEIKGPSGAGRGDRCAPRNYSYM